MERHTGVMSKRVGVVFVHVFDDPQLLQERILRHEFALKAAQALTKSE